MGILKKHEKKTQDFPASHQPRPRRSYSAGRNKRRAATARSAFGERLCVFDKVEHAARAAVVLLFIIPFVLLLKKRAAAREARV